MSTGNHAGNFTGYSGGKSPCYCCPMAIIKNPGRDNLQNDERSYDYHNGTPKQRSGQKLFYFNHCFVL